MLRILMAASEAVPFCKTGGLADVCGALPRELAKLGHETALIIPAYRQVWQCGQAIHDTAIRFDIPVGNEVVTGQLLESRLPDSDVPVYLVRQDGYFNRDSGLYGDNGEDYRDNCERFVFFCRAVLEAVRVLELRPDVLHVNDWQTGLIPAYLRDEYRIVPGLEQTVALQTIHNLAYQGCFPERDMSLTGLDWEHFNWRQMEFHGKLNLLKTGIVFSDALNTVSPCYAEQIQGSPWGCGLEQVLCERSDVLSGILNGIDYDVWNPQSDLHLAANYDSHTWKAGKAACKTALRETLGLPPVVDAPVIGIVSRLVDQKGMDLIDEVIESWLTSSNVQWAVLGTGQPEYHRLFETLSRTYPEKIAARLEFNDHLAHMIEAGADMFLMPSQFEPCGLNQFYSLRYGTIPIVRAVGGLADTITDVQVVGFEEETANGFSFEDYTASALDATLRLAYQTYQTEPEAWQRLVTTAMQQDWSWKQSATRYVQLYERTLARKNQPVPAY